MLSAAVVGTTSLVVVVVAIGVAHTVIVRPPPVNFLRNLACIEASEGKKWHKWGRNIAIIIVRNARIRKNLKKLLLRRDEKASKASQAVKCFFRNFHS